MGRGITSLSHAVRPVVLGYYGSRLSLGLAILTSVPLLVSLALAQWSMSAALGASVGLLVLIWLSGRGLPPPRQVQANEALAVVALAFVLTPLLMAPPLQTAGLTLEDALFESVSAITTTGLSTVEGIPERGAGFLFLRAWMQWYGGLGIAVFSVALIMGHQAGTRRLAEIHSPDDLHASAKTYARRVLVVYGLLTVAAVASFWSAFEHGFDALVHALAAVSTGGFSSYQDSLAGLQSPAGAFLVVGFGILGALPLILYHQLATRGRRNLSGDPEWWVLLLALALSALALTLALFHLEGLPWPAALRHGLLLGASAQTTTGFSTLSVGELGDTAKLLLVAAMLTGGSVGSTAGGIKLLRLLIMVQLVLFILRRTSLPDHAVAAMGLGDRNLEGEEVQRALVVVLLFVATVFISWLLFVAAGHPAIDALFEVVSATATAGLSTGIVRADLAGGLKLVLCLDMLLGRLEILALLVLLYPPTWLGRRTQGP